MSVFRVFVFFALCGLVLGEGYWDIQLSPQSIASVPYGPGHISVWQHASDRERYYAMPLVQLLHGTARVRTNILTGIHEMAFDVLLWSEEAREAVYLFLKREFNSSIAESQIEMLPMEKIRISWRDSVRPISQGYRLVNDWKSNTHLPPVTTCQFTCETRPLCENLKNAMKNTPGVFDALEMEYVINGQRSARRSLSVTGRHVMQGRLWTKMATMPGAGDTRYLNAADLKTLISDSVSNVMGSLVTDSDYVDTGDEVRMNDVLQHVLAREQVSTANFQPHQWSSVFWNPAWARPDKLVHYLNRTLEKDASDSRSFLVKEQAGSRSAGGGGAASVLGLFDISGSGGSNSNSQSKVRKEDILSTLRERHSNVEWTGEQFRVKPMKLFRLNLSTLNTSNNIATANVQVRRYESVYTIKLKVAEDYSSQNPSLTPQLVESRLLQKLNETKSDITEVDEKLQAQSTRLTNTITVKANEVTAKLRPIQSKLNRLDYYGWPNGSYCVLKKGSCPSGTSGVVGGSITFHVGEYTGPNPTIRFGDSHFRFNRGRASVTIGLYVCCH